MRKEKEREEVRVERMQLREKREREREQLGGLRGQPRGGRGRRASGGRPPWR